MKWTWQSGLRVQDVGDETLVLDQIGQIHQLNPTASFIWRQCDGNHSATEIHDMLVREFDVSEAVAAKDVAAVFEKLRALNLLSD